MLTPPSCEGMGKTHEQGSTKYYSTADQRHLFSHRATTQVHFVPVLLRAMVMAPVDVQNQVWGTTGSL